MEYIQVKNWESLQHYKDRTPPWIKLYNHLLDDFDFSCLPDASKAHLISIWLLASRTANKIPNNSRWIANKINATEDVDIDLLVKAGFLERMFNENNELHKAEQDASKLQHKAEQDACLEREERREEERDNTSALQRDRIDYLSVQEIFNESLTKAPKVIKMTDKRKRIVKKFFKEFSLDLEKWKNYLCYINSSKDCEWMFEKRDRGDGQTWQPKGFEYIASESCYLKVKEQYS